MRLFQQLPIPLPVALGGTGVANGNWAATSLAINGAPIGSNALAVTGSINASTTITAGGNIVVSGGSSALAFSGKSYLTSPTDGNFRLTNNAQNNFSLLQFGGTTSSFPALKVNGTGLSARLADDSADTSFTAANINVTGSAVPANGSYLSGASTLSFATASTLSFSINSTQSLIASSVNGWSLRSTDPSNTVPNFVTNRSATGTGVGGSMNTVALIASSLPILTASASGVVVTQPLTLAGGTLLATSSALTNGAGAQLATMTNGPTAGNPTKWITINDNGTTRYIPAW